MPGIGNSVFFAEFAQVPTHLSSLLGFAGQAEWNSWFIRVLGMLLSGATMDVRDPRGRPILDGTFLVLLNAYWERVPFVLPGEHDVEWELILDTSEDDGFLEAPKFFASSSPFDLGPRSLGVFGLHEGTDAQARADAWQIAEAAA